LSSITFSTAFSYWHLKVILVSRRIVSDERRPTAMAGPDRESTAPRQQ
jgi:hypothetical protein